MGEGRIAKHRLVRCRGLAQHQSTRHQQSRSRHIARQPQTAAEVSASGHQPCAGKADLTLGDQVRQLGRQGEAAYAHGHNPGQEAGEASNQRGYGDSPERVVGFPCQGLEVFIKSE